MKRPSFGQKPSPTHLVWTDGTGSDGTARKRFDEDELRSWCGKVGADYERGHRVDHERSDDSRAQYQCVFAWQEEAEESFELDGKEWDISPQRTPRTFVELDSEGMLRVKTDEAEYVIDVTEMWYDGAELRFESTEFDGVRGLDARKLVP